MQVHLVTVGVVSYEQRLLACKFFEKYSQHLWSGPSHVLLLGEEEPKLQCRQ